MRKSLFFAVIALMMAMLGVCLTACGSNGDEEPGDGSTDSKLNGTWVATAKDDASTGTFTFEFKGNNVSYTEKWSEPGYDDDIETYKGTFVAEDGLLTMHLERTDYPDSFDCVFKYSVSGKSLVLTSVGDNYFADDGDTKTFTKR